jgi:hypothetical protein
MDLKDIKGMSELLAMGGNLESIVEGLKSSLSKEQVEEFEKELKKTGYKKTVKEFNSLKDQNLNIG